jgi:hypothetical protein
MKGEKGIGKFLTKWNSFEEESTVRPTPNSNIRNDSNNLTD